MRQLDFGCKITCQNIANEFGIDINNVTQIDSKHLFIVELSNGKTALVSYYTIVGYYVFGTWYITSKKYSATTSRQLSKFASGRTVIKVDDIDNIDFDNINGSKGAFGLILNK